MFSIPEDDFRRLVEDVALGRALSPASVAAQLGVTELALRSAARQAYPLTRPDDAVQFALRELVMSAHAGSQSLQENLVWRLVRGAG